MANGKRIVTTIVGVVMIVFIGYVCLVECMYVGNNKGKLWLHKAYPLEKFEAMREYYPNVEIDVVMRRDGRFDITHWEEKTIGLGIDPYMEYLSENKECKIWLDVKNLNEETDSIMLARLDTLCERYGIEHERLIVESPSWELLEPFTEEGYYTSCYVEEEKPDGMSDEDIEAVMERLRKVVDSGKVRALSFAGWWYGTMKERLERNDIGMLTWKHRSTELELMMTPEGHKMMEDEQLKVVLVKDIRLLRQIVGKKYKQEYKDYAE